MEKQPISIDVFTAASQYVKERDYCTQKLSGVLSKNYFPYDHCKNKTSHSLTSKKDLMPICFCGEVFSKLMKLCRRQDYGLHMIAAAAVVATDITAPRSLSLKLLPSSLLSTSITPSIR